MKKTIMILLAAIMVIGLFAACGGNETEAGERTLTIGVPDNIAVTDYETNKLTLWLEEQMDVDLKFVRFTNGAGSADYLQKLTLMTVGGQTLPDIVWGINTNDNTTIRDLGEQGAFIDLSDLIEQYAPTYKAKLAEADPAMQQKVASLGTTADGAFYGMPKTGTMSYDAAMSYMWINTVWLDKLNLEKPKTLEDLYTVLEAFKTQDPNGNNIADEIPMAGMHHNLTCYIASAFLYHGPYNWLSGEDGEIYASVTSDAYRQALIVLNDMFKKGYITTASATIEDYPTWRAYIQPANDADTPYNVVGMFAANPVLSTNKGDLRFLEYEAVTELASEEGYDGGWYYYSTPGVQFTTFITKDCAENKRALAMQVIDFMYSDEFVARSRHGEFGVDWKFVEGKNFENAGNGERIIDTSIGDGKAYTEGNRTWGATPSNIGTNKNQTAAAVPTKDVWQAHYDKVTAPLREYIYEVELPEIVAKDFDLNEKEQKVWDDCWNLLDACFRRWRSEFMTNVKDPNKDADWNAFLAEMESLGLSRLLEACQDSFDRTNAK